MYNSSCLISLTGSSDEVFSLALYHFNHTLVTSDLPSPALQVRDETCIAKNVFGQHFNFWVVIFTCTCLCFSRIHFFNSWALLLFQRVLGPCIFILSHCQCYPGFSSFGSTKQPCKENQTCLSVWKSGKGISLSINLRFNINQCWLVNYIVFTARAEFYIIFEEILQTNFFFNAHLNFSLCSYRFLATLKQNTIQSSVHGEDDLNVEHLQLLLLLFHNLSERGRRSVLTQVTQAITEVAQNRDSQLKAVPLNLSRLCLVFDYLLRHYSKPPLYLFEQVIRYF